MADVVESVQVRTPAFAPYVTGADASVLERTVTDPHETPATPDGVNVGADDCHDVPAPMKRIVRVCEGRTNVGEMSSVAIDQSSEVVVIRSESGTSGGVESAVKEATTVLPSSAVAL